MKDNIKIALSVIAFILALDFIAFLAWVYSGQAPYNDVYAGMITTRILQIIF